MEKEQTPEKTTDDKPDEQKTEAQPSAEEASTKPVEHMDSEPHIAPDGVSPKSETAAEPESEPETAAEPEPESAAEPEPEPEPEPAAEPVQPLPDLTATQLTESDPLNKTLAYGGFILLILAIILVGASLMNTARFYVIERDGAVEVWQGRFSPKANERLIVMPGVDPPALKKKVYTRNDVYPIISKYYQEKSEALLDVPGLPDFYGIKGYLDKAMTYATTEQERQSVQRRMDSLDLSILLYKADMSAGKGTLAGLNAAQAYLGLASELNPDEIMAGLIQQKLDSIERMKTALEAEYAQPVEEPAPEAAAEGESKDEAIQAEKQSEPVEEPQSAPQPPASEGAKKEQSF